MEPQFTMLRSRDLSIMTIIREVIRKAVLDHLQASMENRNVGLGVGIFPPSRDSIKSALVARTFENGRQACRRWLAAL